MPRRTSGWHGSRADTQGTSSAPWGASKGPPKPPDARRRPGEAGAPLDSLTDVSTGPETPGQIAAVDCEGVAGDVAGIVGGEEESGPGHLVGLAEASHRDALPPSPPRVLGKTPREPGVDLGGGDRVHRDVMLGELHGHGPGHLDHAGLGDVVADEVLDST